MVDGEELCWVLPQRCVDLTTRNEVVDTHIQIRIRSVEAGSDVHGTQPS